MRFRRSLIISLIVLAALLLAGAAVWMIAPFCVEDPFDTLGMQTPVRVWTDRTGHVIWNERTYDAQWRFPVPLKQISPHAVRMILAAEDAHFYQHNGVDYSAVFRAAWQNLTSFRRISGASTISMQLAGMTIPGNDRSFRRKFLQAAKARKMERLHGKEEILTEYMNRIPFGGKIFGIEAASLYYFGLHASDLNPAEAAYLCGLPQKPNRFRPDRHPEAAKERQRIVLHLLTRRGLIAEQEAERILKEEPLRLRDFSVPAPFAATASSRELFHHIARIRKKDTPYRVTTSLDLNLHHSVLNLLKTQKNSLKDVHDAAAIVIDNKTGEILVSIGTLDFTDPHSGEVDAVRAIRSAGSTLKPLIYAEAIAGGWIVADTILQDAPVRYGSYSPGNFDGLYRGNVTASTALADSLNTPAVRLVAKLGENRVRQTLNRAGLKDCLAAKGLPTGLAIALGADGFRMLDLACAYAMLANGGTLPELRLIHEDRPLIPASPDPVFPGKVCAMVASMLRTHSPGTLPFPIAWKTGTSNNNCDAWCFAFTPDFTVGIWFGNKDGSRSPDLVGATAALPAATAVFAMLYRDRPLPQRENDDALFEMRELCTVSGLAPSTACGKTFSARTIPGLPLAGCRVCNGRKHDTLKIFSPAPGDYLVPPGGNAVHFNLKASSDRVLWFINGLLIDDPSTGYDFSAGKRYIIRAVEKDGAATAESVISVRNR